MRTGAALRALQIIVRIPLFHGRAGSHYIGLSIIYLGFHEPGFAVSPIPFQLWAVQQQVRIPFLHSPGVNMPLTWMVWARAVFVLINKHILVSLG